MAMLKTKIDEMVEFIAVGKLKSYRSISKKLSWREESVEKIALILEKARLAKTHYPINMIEQPTVEMVGPLAKALPEQPAGNLVEEYAVSSRENLPMGTVRLLSFENGKRPTYFLILPDISPYTRAYIEYVKEEVSKRLPIMGEEKSREVASENFKIRYALIASILTRDIESDKETIDQLADVVVSEMYGLGELEALIGDKKLEEIVINSSKFPVSVYHRSYGWLQSNIVMDSEAKIENFAQQIARKVGRQISVLNPLLDAHLETGDRVNATLYPISSGGNTLTLRLFARNPWTIVTLTSKEVRSMTPEMAALLWQAMQYEMNVLVAGGTASGKTSALNGLLALIQPFQRIVTIEDTRELMLPRFQWNWVPMVTRMPNPEGLGEVTMLELLVNALRMRPDRIVMGEIRRKREAEVLFEAMHTGHSVYTTLHADTGSQVLKRLIEPPIELPPSETEDLHLLLVQFRDRRKNIRRTLELCEVVSGPTGPELNRIFTWKPRGDTFQFVKSPHRYLEELNLHTGMTETEVMQDQKDKVKVINWMAKNGLQDVDDVGKVMGVYYTDPDALVLAAEKGTSPSKVL